MSLLIDAVENMEYKAGEAKAGRARTPYAFKTGIDLLDYKNGMLFTPAKGDPYLSLGIREGSMIQLIGNSGTGKTALAHKIASTIAAKYENSEIIFDDIEAGTDETRFMNISGWDMDMVSEKFYRRNQGVYSEQFKTLLLKIVKQKRQFAKELKDKYLIETEKCDFMGRPIVIYPPTLYILDSLATLIPQDLKEDEDLASNMQYATIAKTNSQIFHQIIPALVETNIILLIVNHLSTKININAYKYNRPDINYLDENENVPGGRAALYLANNVFKLTAGSRLKEDEEYRIAGFRSKLKLIKSRSNRAGAEFELVFDQVHGINNTLSNFEFLLAEGQIAVGRGSAGCYFVDEPDSKFQKAKLVDLIENNPEFRKKINLKTRQILKSRVPTMTEDI